MSCLQAEWLHGYFDGELDAARAAEFERHLAGCTACVAALAELQALRDGLAGAGLYAPAPPSLRARVRGALPARPSPSLPGRLIWPGAAAAAVAIVFFGLWRFGGGPREPSPERVVVAAILDAHLRSLQPAHLTDVASSDQHTVKPWFDGRLDYSPPVADLGSEGYPLVGGRLDVVAGRSVAALVYGRRRHVVSLFVWPSEEAEAAARSGSVRGYQWIHWTRRGTAFWAVSDAAAADLQELARLLGAEAR